MSPAPELPPLPILNEAQAVTRSSLCDGTRIEVNLNTRSVNVILPTPEEAALHEAINARFLARMDQKRRKATAIAMKLAEPARSYASIAREMNVSANSLSRWVKAAIAV